MQSSNNGYSETSKRGWFTRFLDMVEWLGNLLPHPITLFAIFCLLVIVASGIAAYFGVSAIDPRDGETVIQAVSLLNAEGIQKIVTNLVTNCTGFTPLGTVLVALLGVGVAERSGLISAAMRGLSCRFNWTNGGHTNGCFIKYLGKKQRGG